MTASPALLAPARRRRILELLSRQEFIAHHEILAATGTSIATVRRDLVLLERAGALVRLRGGATRPRATRADSRDLVRLLAEAMNALRGGDLYGTERTLRRALHTCELLRAGPDAARGKVCVGTRQASTERAQNGDRVVVPGDDS